MKDGWKKEQKMAENIKMPWNKTKFLRKMAENFEKKAGK